MTAAAKTFFGIQATLQARMIFLVCLLVLSLTLVSGAIYTAIIGEVVEDQIGKRALQVSRTVAQIPLVKRKIVVSRPDGVLQELPNASAKRSAPSSLSSATGEASVSPIRFRNGSAGRWLAATTPRP